MKKIVFTLSLLLFMASMIYAQMPQRFSYQAVVRNSSGQLISHKPIGLKIEILQGSATGTLVYSETQTVTTNIYGLLSTEVGIGTEFADIQWSNGPYYIHTFLDLEGGTDYTLETTQQIFPVPFALNASIADSLAGGAIRHETDPIFTAWDKDYNDLTNRPVNISTWVNDAGYITGYTEVQALSISNDTIFLTGGSFVKLPAGFDGDYNHLTNRPTAISTWTNDVGYITSYTEVQALSMHHDTIYLTGGSYVVLPLVAEHQDLASVVGFGNSANNHQLKDVLDPTDPQDAVTLHYLDSVMALLGFDSTQLGSHNIYTVDACDYYDWNGLHCTVGGTYVYPYSNLGGYYSVDTLHLSIRHGTHNVDYRTAYGSYTWHDTLYTSSGIYPYHYVNLNGCPSTDTLHLTINAGGGSHCTAYRQADDTTTVIACGGYHWYGSILTYSGVHEHSLGAISVQGCDSVVRINLQLREVFRTDTAIRTLNPITWRGHLYTYQGDYDDTLTDQHGCDSIYSLHLMIGGSNGIGGAPGRYSVSSSKQVLFAHGNLLYQSANNVWKIAENQYDRYDVYCAGAYYRPYADIFSWATSGYHDDLDSLNTYFKPWQYYNTPATLGTYEYENNRYGYGPSSYMSDTNLVGTSLNYDWGMYNPIINGGNGAGMWRTLTREEWDYLFNSRNNASYLRSLGRINIGGSYVEGYIILADNWTNPGGVSFTANATSTSTNSYTLTQWKQLESSGAVFLPSGFYWSSTSGNSGGAYCLNTAFATPMIAVYNRSNRYHVRLAQDYVPGAVECSCTYYDTVIVSNGPYSWHGHNYTQAGDYMEAVVNNAGCDSIISFSLLINEPGTLDSLFSVGVDKKVYFSRGNLQYQASHDIWRFGMYQYDYLGTDNKYISDTNKGWIDLFGFGTSGYHDPSDHLNVYYEPTSTSQSSYYGPSPNMGEQSLVNDSKNYDWGQYNPIANGGNQSGLWRTLTTDEWYYLISSRPNAGSLWRNCTINGVFGLLLLPDNWTQPDGFYFNATNVYEGPDWLLLENSGAVFLPAAGCRSGKNISSQGECYYYWSSSSYPYSSSAHNLYVSKYSDGSLSGIYVAPNPSYNGSNMSRYYGCSVRLVKDY